MNYTAMQLARQVECAKQAGIYDSMFLAFGALLGCVRERKIISGDDDLDVGFIADDITKEQEDEYIRLIGTPTKDFPGKGLYEYRCVKAIREDTGRLFWTSIRGRPVETCFKCCHWFFWNHAGYAWHCKGKGTMVKGCPAKYITPGPEVEFLGVKIRIPKMTGAILDFWYPDWYTCRMGGNSARTITMTVSDWATMKGRVNEN